jgi:hypothetical protein
MNRVNSTRAFRPYSVREGELSPSYTKSNEKYFELDIESIEKCGINLTV